MSEEYTETVTVKVKPSQKDRFQEQAEREGVPVSTWLRMQGIRRLDQAATNGRAC